MSKHSIRTGSASRPSALLQAVERLDALLAAALGLELLLVEREARVALGELEDAPLVAALGGADLDARRRGARRGARRATSSAEPSATSAARRSAAGSTARSRSTGAGTPRRRAAGVVPRLVVEVEALAVAEDAVADLEDLRVGLGARRRATATASNGPDGLVGDPLALEQRADRLQPVALDRRLLEVLLAGVRSTSALEVALDLACSGRRGTRSRRRSPSRYSSLET